MKKKKIFILGILLIAVCSLFAGCTGFKSRIDPEKHKWTVIYHANGGDLKGMEVREMHIMDTATLPVPGSNNMPKESRENYDSLGWYIVTLDEKGAITTDENGKQIFGKEVNFLTDRVTSDFVIAVQWQKKVTYDFQVGAVEGEASVPADCTISNPKTYSVSTLLMLSEPTGSEIPQAKGYTLLGYYWDKECTEKVDFTLPLTQEQMDDYLVKWEQDDKYSIPVYTRWLKGEYTLVYTAKEFSRIGGNKRYYLMNDIDMGSDSISQLGAFTGLIEGNNKTVSNLVVKVTQKRNVLRYGGIFSTLKGAEIRNLTLDNVTVDFEIGVDGSGGEPLTCNVSVLASTIEDCTFTNFKIKGQMDISRKQYTSGEDNTYNVDVVYYGLMLDDQPLQTVKSGTSKDEDGRSFDYTLNGNGQN